MILFKKIKSVYRWFTNVSGGAHGNTRGFHGSLTALSLKEVLNEVDVYGRNFVDIGFGTGVVLAAALVSGASKAHGFELPENQANKYIFEAATRKISEKISSSHVTYRIFPVELVWNSTTSHRFCLAEFTTCS